MFKSGHAAVWFGRRKQKEVLNMCKAHVDKIVETVQEMERFIQVFCNGDLEGAKKAFETVFESERRADEIKKRILYEASKGPLHPIDRDEVVRLVLTADDIAANAKSATRKLVLSEFVDVPDQIKSGLKELAKRLVLTVEKMRNCLEKLIDDPTAAIELADEVERLEEEIDEYRVALLLKILRFGDEAKSVSGWLMVKEAVENMENVADRAEDVADVIRSIAILG